MATATQKQSLEDKRIQAILQWIAKLNIAELEAWSAVDELSSRTVFTGSYADADGVFVSGDSFKVVFEVSVELNYGRGRDKVTSGDSFPAYAEGRFDGDGIDLGNLKIDTSSFYE